MHRVLLLMPTTTYRAAAFLEAGRRLGVEIVVGSDRRQALEEISPSSTLTLDFLALEEATAQVVRVARERPFHAVVPVDDEATVLAATIAGALGLPHNSVQAARAARNKHLMRQLLADAGIRVPRFQLCSVDDDPMELAGKASFPCVLKPLFLSASRGIIRANDATEFVEAFHQVAQILRTPEVAARGGALARQILVEAYIPGQEFALEGLLTRGTLKVLALFDKPDPLQGPFFEETLYVTPSRSPVALQEEIASCVSRTAAALGLREGPVHVELRVNEQGPWIIEIAARSIGGLCSRTLRFGPGVSLEELILRHSLGMETESLERDPQPAGVMMVPIPRAGILRHVRGLEEAKAVPGIEDIVISIALGHPVVPLPEGSRYLGFIFSREETPDRVEAALREADRRLEFVIEPVEASED